MCCQLAFELKLEQIKCRVHPPPHTYVLLPWRKSFKKRQMRSCLGKGTKNLVYGPNAECNFVVPHTKRHHLVCKWLISLLFFLSFWIKTSCWSPKKNLSNQFLGCNLYMLRQRCWGEAVVRYISPIAPGINNSWKPIVIIGQCSWWFSCCEVYQV